MDKYIIDGVEYSYGEAVEVSDDSKEWKISKIVGVDSSRSYPIITEEHGNFLKVRKIQPTLSGRKAKLILDDGTEYSVTVE